MDFGGPGKLVPANSAHLGRWAGLAGTGLPGPLKAMKKNFFGYFLLFHTWKGIKRPIKWSLYLQEVFTSTIGKMWILHEKSSWKHTKNSFYLKPSSMSDVIDEKWQVKIPKWYLL